MTPYPNEREQTATFLNRSCCRCKSRLQFKSHSPQKPTCLVLRVRNDIKKLPFGRVNQAYVFSGGKVICANHMGVSHIVGVALLWGPLCGLGLSLPLGLGLSLSLGLGLSLSLTSIHPFYIGHMQTKNLSTSR